ncbi:hypothetical protein GQX74_003007 [Glossina fuscipes]|nr:hypothetical protein GQX74_003007 [Glossina fuscipes]
MTMDASNQRMAKIQAQIRDVRPTPSNASSSPMTSEHFISKTIFNDIKSEIVPTHEQEHLSFHATEKSKTINDNGHNGGRVDNKLMNIPLNDKPGKSTGVTRKTHSKSGQSSLLGNVIKESNVEAESSREHNVNASHHSSHNNTQHRHHRYRRHTMSEYTPRQDYKLLFANDFDDSKKRSNSEVHLLDSTDSMKNYYSRSTTESSQNSEGDYKSNDSCPDVCNHSDSLSTSSPTYAEQMKILHIVERNDSFRKKEGAGLYLRSCSYGSSPFTRYEYCKRPDSNWLLPKPQTMTNTVYHRSSKCICVLNGSEPGFKIFQAPHPDINIALPLKFKAEELLIMRSTLDIRIQKVLQTFQENSHSKYKESIEVPKENYIKVFPPNLAVGSQEQRGSQEIVEVNTSETTSEEQISYELTAINNPMNLTKTIPHWYFSYLMYIKSIIIHRLMFLPGSFAHIG